MTTSTTRVGFIGQGWIGKHYADDFEKRGYTIVRYSLEPEYEKNVEEIKDCGVVFIAVPTPTTSDGFDYKAIQSALGSVVPNTIVVIKSTTMVGVCTKLQNEFKDLLILHSPEFLVKKTAAYDASNPQRNIIGVSVMNERNLSAAKQVLDLLPTAPYEKIMTYEESELVKYAGNCFLYTKVLFMNVLYDIANELDIDFEQIKDALVHDPRIGESHTTPVHSSGRGAGGHCLIKDFESFRALAHEQLDSKNAKSLLDNLKNYNNELLIDSGKDIDLLEGVYGATPPVSSA